MSGERSLSGELRLMSDVRLKNTMKIVILNTVLVAVLLIPCRLLANDPKGVESLDLLIKSPSQVLERFFRYLTTEDYSAAYSLLAPIPVEKVRPAVNQAPLEIEVFRKELERVSPLKFGSYKLGESESETPDRYRVKVEFGTGDRDEAVLIRHNSRWYVVNPIHLIR